MKKIALKNKKEIPHICIVMDDIIASGISLNRGSLLSNLYTNFRNTQISTILIT